MSAKDFIGSRALSVLMRNVQSGLASVLTENDLKEITEEDLIHMMRVNGIEIPEFVPGVTPNDVDVAIQAAITKAKNEINATIKELDGSVVKQEDFGNKVAEAMDPLWTTIAQLQETYNQRINEVAAVANNAQSLAQSMVSSGAKIQIGTYIGSGSYGSANKNSLTFDFTPKIVFLSGGPNNMVSSPMINGTYIATVTVGGGTTTNLETKPIYLTWENNTVKWYSSLSAPYQLNNAGSQFYYVAIG